MTCMQFQGHNAFDKFFKRLLTCITDKAESMVGATPGLGSKDIHKRYIYIYIYIYIYMCISYNTGNARVPVL